MKSQVSPVSHGAAALEVERSGKPFSAVCLKQLVHSSAIVFLLFVRIGLRFGPLIKFLCFLLAAWTDNLANLVSGSKRQWQ
jgi:hypothetical protein